MSSQALAGGVPSPTSVGGGRRPARPKATAAAWLYLPAGLFMALIFLLPLGIMVWISLTSPTTSLANYQMVLTTPVYAKILLITLRISLLTAIVSLVIAYPYAYLMSRSRGLVAGLLGLVVLFPYLTSNVVRAFTWYAILTSNGPVPGVFKALGINPPTMLGNTFSVTVGIVQTQLPLVILPIYASLVAVKPDYLRAASSMGANKIRTFLRVTLPLTRQGIVLGLILGFVYALGAYVTPAILGGRGTTLIGPAIQTTLQVSINGFGLAAAMGVSVIVVTLVVLVIASRFASLQGLVGR
jgi:putative spermidine/putrescine transport system permease protein